MGILLTEADLKRTVEDYLTYRMNAGELVYLRLNAGDFIEIRGNTRRRVKGCLAGTADFLILTRFKCALWIPRPIFIELKSAKGRTSPEQNAFKILVEAQLSEYFVVRKLEELEEILK